MDNTPPGAGSPSPKLSIIAAVAADGGIGRGNSLPWRLPEDLKRFKSLTLGHRIIMGRKTWESLGRALPGRENVVVTRSAGYSAAGALVVHSLAAAIALPGAGAEVFCIGGAEIYAQALAQADRLYLTEIDRAFPADTYFPPFDRAAWHCTSRQSMRQNGSDGAEGFGYHFAVYERTLPAHDVSKGEQ